MYVFVKTATILPFLSDNAPGTQFFSENLLRHHLAQRCKWVLVLDSDTTQIAFESEHEEEVLCLLDMYEVVWTRTDPLSN